MDLEFISIIIESWLFILEELIPNPETCQYFGIVPVVSMCTARELGRTLPEFGCLRENTSRTDHQ